MPHKKVISVHTLVKNEESYLWYAVMSILPYVDEVKIWDTGSTDNTKIIIQELLKNYPDKISFKEVGEVGPEKFTMARQQMLEQTKADWVLILDGDEVWWKDSIEKVVKVINDSSEEEIDAIVSPFIDAVGDIFHYQGEAAGRYKIDGKVGNITIRAFRTGIAGLHLSNDYGQEGLMDTSGKFIQESGEVKRKFVNEPFLHLTHLERSSVDNDVMQRGPKLKHELGIPFSKDFYYPEVFFRDKPDFIPSPWKVMSKPFKSRAFFETPLRKIRRRFYTGKAGY